jgi:hypothetical protein
MRKLLAVHDAAPPHRVGDGFPVRSIFSYDGLGRMPASRAPTGTAASILFASP